jgi:hypothetical protein
MGSVVEKGMAKVVNLTGYSDSPRVGLWCCKGRRIKKGSKR